MTPIGPNGALPHRMNRWSGGSRGCRIRIGRRGRVAMLCTAAVLLPAAVEAQWAKPINWLIPCTALLESRLGVNHPVCNEVNREGGIKATVDRASLWLQELGFASPAISANLDLAHHVSRQKKDLRDLQVASQRDSRCEVRYCAWLVLGLGNSHGAYSWSDSSLVLDPFRMTERGPEPGYGDGFGFAEVHELFHAVQAGYPNIQAARDADYLDWILEGSADHAALAAGKTAGLSVAMDVKFRTYDQPLHAPPNEDPQDPAFQRWAYGSWEFFDFLGDHLGSRDGVQYLDSLFSILRPGQENGLRAVAAVARRPSGEGMYDAFPEFVARRLLRPCYFSHLGEWEGSRCVEGPENEHRFTLAFPDTVRREHTVAPLSANGYLVRMEVPQGKLGALVIRVPPDRDHENLHLVVDGHRHDETGPFGRRNVYAELLRAGRHEFLVRLAHVPRDLSTVDVAAGNMDFGAPAPDHAPLEFFLMAAPFWTMTLGGVRSGSFAGQHATARSGPEGINSINLLSDAGDSRHLIAITFEPRNPLTTTGTLTPAGVSIGLAMERIGTAEADGFCTPRSPDPSYPPVPSVTVTALTDQYVAGVINGVMYRCDPGHKPDERNDVRIEFVATVCPRGVPCRR